MQEPRSVWNAYTRVIKNLTRRGPVRIDTRIDTVRARKEKLFEITVGGIVDSQTNCVRSTHANVRSLQPEVLT